MGGGGGGEIKGTGKGRGQNSVKSIPEDRAQEGVDGGSVGGGGQREACRLDECVGEFLGGEENGNRSGGSGLPVLRRKMALNQRDTGSPQ